MLWDGRRDRAAAGIAAAAFTGSGGSWVRGFLTGRPRGRARARVQGCALVLVGMDDELTPVAESIAMSSAIPGSRLVTVPDAGHLAPLEQPQVVNAAIAEFLDVAVRDA